MYDTFLPRRYCISSNGWFSIVMLVFRGVPVGSMYHILFTYMKNPQNQPFMSVNIPYSPMDPSWEYIAKAINLEKLHQCTPLTNKTRTGWP